MSDALDAYLKTSQGRKDRRAQDLARSRARNAARRDATDALDGYMDSERGSQDQRAQDFASMRAKSAPPAGGSDVGGTPGQNRQRSWSNYTGNNPMRQRAWDNYSSPGRPEGESIGPRLSRPPITTTNMPLTRALDNVRGFNARGEATGATESPFPSYTAGGSRRRGSTNPSSSGPAASRGSEPVSMSAGGGAVRDVSSDGGDEGALGTRFVIDPETGEYVPERGSRLSLAVGRMRGR